MQVLDRWYSRYELRIAKVERAYAGPEGRRCIVGHSG